MLLEKLTLLLEEKGYLKNPETGKIEPGSLDTALKQYFDKILKDLNKEDLDEVVQDKSQYEKYLEAIIEYASDTYSGEPVIDYIKNNKSRLITRLMSVDALDESLAENSNPEDKIDIVTMDVPLFIRILEYSREDAQTDMDLHDLAEKAIAGTKQQGILSMDDYDMLTGEQEQLTEASVPSNIREFAKRKGVSSLVNKVASWAKRVGKRITGGTAVGRDYDTLVLDMGYQTSDIRIDCDEETVELYGEPVNSFADFKRVFEANSSRVEENMSLDDEAKAYFLAKIKRGEIDTLPEDPKAAFLAQMTKDQIAHDEETLRRERGLEENIFKVGQKVTYLGHPAVVTATREYNGKDYVSVSYDKGNGKTKASDILATNGDVEPLSEMAKKIYESMKTVVETIQLGKQLNEAELCQRGKDYISARKRAGEKSSAYLSGRAVRVCKGDIEFKGKKQKDFKG